MGALAICEAHSFAIDTTEQIDHRKHRKMLFWWLISGVVRLLPGMQAAKIGTSANRTILPGPNVRFVPL